MQATCEYHNQLMQDIGAIKNGIRDIKENQDKINGRYDDHIKTSVNYRIKVEKHDESLQEINKLRRWWWGAILTIIIGLLSLAVTWGMVLEKVFKLEKQVYAEEQLLKK